MKTLIENTIHWAKIGKHAKEAYQYSLEKAVVSRKTAALSVDIRLNFIFPWEDVTRLKVLIKKEFPELRDVKFHFIYEEVILTEQEIVKLYIPHMIHSVSEECAFFTKTIFPDEFTYKSGTLTILALGDMAVDQLNCRVAKLFEGQIKLHFNMVVDVTFQNHRDSYKKCAMEQEAIMDQALLAASKVQKSAQSKPSKQELSPTGTEGVYSSVGQSGGFPQNNFAKRRRDKETPVVGNQIMGKRNLDEAIPMGEVTQDKGIVTVEGILFKKDSRPIKNNKRLVTLFITDKSTSLCVKAFTSEQKWIEIDDHLSEGDFVKIRGNCEWDTYENVVVIMAKDIEKGEVKIRRDLCERKRVELHAHTKMSAMDGLNEVIDMVKLAASWGHPAIAITDHGVVQSFPDAAKAAKNLKKSKDIDIKIIYGLEGYLLPDEGLIGEDGSINYKAKDRGTNHIILLAKNQEGLTNLYKLVSFSHLHYFYKKPRIPRSILSQYRSGLIIGSACEAGEVYQAVLHQKSDEEIEAIASFYDYLEIQPLINNRFLVEEKKLVADKEGLRELNRRIVALGEKLGKPVVATTDAHYTEPDEALYRNILFAGQGYKDAEGGQGLYLRTTDEMLQEFSYLGEEMAQRVVIDNTAAIAELIEEIKPVPSGKFPPKIQGAEDILRTKCMERAWSIYGNPLPEKIQARLDKELNSIIGNGYAVMYVSAEMLVQKSLSDGYLVGSRGSVGSSFAATMAGITEVNPLPPHYICSDCKRLEWGDENEFDCGVDMPEKNCPNCGSRMRQDGFSIPFETFLGFDGDKEPDIDLNFAGEYQATAHKYVDTIFGAKNVYKAGTIGTVADKTAYGFVMKYYEERQQPVNKFEADRLAMCCTGVKRTTGQHPGGIIVVPDDHEIYEFCPVQHPANDANSDIVTTHFDYHKIDENLLKLDILGHDVPSMIRQLQDMTDTDPLTLPLKDERVNGIFKGIEGLDVKDADYKFVHGSYGIPEFGTKFTRQMLDDTQPSRFADFVRISGFSHGTDVWINNAQEFIKNGQATIKDAISTRDDIMNYLRLKGLPDKKAFTIMEKVRKGKGVTDEDAQLMRDNHVPEWYIESCRRIKYMFPRAHAVAYVMMSYRIAYYKVYYPAQFYAVYFTTKVSEFNAETILKGKQAVIDRLFLIEAMGKNASKKEQDEMTVLEVAYEMYARGYEFLQAELGKSHAVHFTVCDDRVLLPFVALEGVGENAARAIAQEYERRPYISIDDLRNRTKVNRTAVDALISHGVLKGLPESDQLSLF